MHNISINTSNREEELKIDFKKQRMKGFLRFVTFKDHEYEVAYIPSLNLTGYGDTAKEAIEMLSGVVLKDFMSELFQLPKHKIMAELKQYGWVRKPILTKQFRNTVYVDKSGILKTFNLPDETVVEEQYLAA